MGDLLCESGLAFIGGWFKVAPVKDSPSKWSVLPNSNLIIETRCRHVKANKVVVTNRLLNSGVPVMYNDFVPDPGAGDWVALGR